MIRGIREMSLGATVVGAVLGLSVQLHSNVLRKLLLMRREFSSTLRLFDLIWFYFILQNLFLILDPWEHVLAIGIGAVFGNQLVKWEAKVEEDLDKLLKKAKVANEHCYIGTFSIFYAANLYSSYFVTPSALTKDWLSPILCYFWFSLLLFIDLNPDPNIYLIWGLFFFFLKFPFSLHLKLGIY